MKAITRVVSGSDGEMIRVDEFGEPGGKPVLVHSGSPGSRQLFRLDAALGRLNVSTDIKPVTATWIAGAAQMLICRKP
jgi:hypothetical protein